MLYETDWRFGDADNLTDGDSRGADFGFRIIGKCSVIYVMRIEYRCIINRIAC